MDLPWLLVWLDVLGLYLGFEVTRVRIHRVFHLLETVSMLFGTFCRNVRGTGLTEARPAPGSLIPQCLVEVEELGFAIKFSGIHGQPLRLHPALLCQIIDKVELGLGGMVRDASHRSLPHVSRETCSINQGHSLSRTYCGETFKKVSSQGNFSFYFARSPLSS